MLDQELNFQVRWVYCHWPEAQSEENAAHLLSSTLQPAEIKTGGEGKGKKGEGKKGEGTPKAAPKASAPKTKAMAATLPKAKSNLLSAVRLHRLLDEFGFEDYKDASVALQALAKSLKTCSKDDGIKVKRNDGGDGENTTVQKNRFYIYQTVRQTIFVILPVHDHTGIAANPFWSAFIRPFHSPFTFSEQNMSSFPDHRYFSEVEAENLYGAGLETSPQAYLKLVAMCFGFMGMAPQIAARQRGLYSRPIVDLTPGMGVHSVE